MAGPQGPKGHKGRLIQPPMSLIIADTGPPGEPGNYNLMNL